MENKPELSEAVQVVSEYLTDINAHTAEAFLQWITGEGVYTTAEYEIFLKAYEAMKDLILPFYGFKTESAGN